MDTPHVTASWAPFVAFAVAVSVTFFLRSRWAASLALDHPNERSLHSSPVPRTGGIGAMLGILGASLVTPAFAFLLWFIIPLALVSLLDDFKGLPAAMRLAVHLAAAAAFSLIMTDLPFPWWMVVAFAIVWMVNLYNFMDGSDGLAGGMAVIGFGTYGAAAWIQGDLVLAQVAWCVAAAATGFLIFNFSPATIFLGDVGSIPLGFLAGALGALGVVRDVWSWWFPLVVFAPFVVDATTTLLHRVLRRQKVWQAHKDHYYQRLVRMGWSHRRTALAEYGLMAVCASGAVSGFFLDASGRIAVLALVAVIMAASMRMVDAKWAKAAMK